MVATPLLDFETSITFAKSSRTTTLPMTMSTNQPRSKLSTSTESTSMTGVFLTGRGSGSRGFTLPPPIVYYFLRAEKEAWE